MLYVKSIAAGLGALVIGVFLSVVITAIAIWPRRGETVGIDLRSLFVQPLFGVIAVLSFAAGFYWNYRRAVR